LFLVGDVMHRQVGILYQTFLDVMSASDDPEQAGIGYRLIIGILDKDSHLATDAFQTCRHHQR
jgi:hypothetical protein